MHPANDYVRRFVADVNRAKVLQVRSIMTRLNGADPHPGDTPITVKTHDTAEDVLNAVVLKNQSSIRVENEAGEQVGYIKRADLAETIGRDTSLDSRSRGSDLGPT